MRSDNAAEHDPHRGKEHTAVNDYSNDFLGRLFIRISPLHSVTVDFILSDTPRVRPS